ncbi:hypothetical protein EPN52_05345 [bacterium]|nr:MAG: hypothetical protein EPN52_05345 [bacterium]
MKNSSRAVREDFMPPSDAWGVLPTIVVPLATPVDQRIVEAVVADLIERPVRILLLAVLRLPEPASLPYDQRLREPTADARELEALRQLHALSARLRGAGRAVTLVVSWGPLLETVAAVAQGFAAEVLLAELADPLPSTDARHVLAATPNSRLLRVAVHAASA